MRSRRHLKSLRALAECYHAFGRLSGAHVRKLGYTPELFIQMIGQIYSNRLRHYASTFNKLTLPLTEH